MSEPSRRRRMGTFSYKEETRLLLIASDFKEIVDSKSYSTEKMQQKKEAWEKITERFNQEGGIYRSDSQLMKKYLGLKYRDRKEPRHSMRRYSVDDVSSDAMSEHNYAIRGPRFHRVPKTPPLGADEDDASLVIEDDVKPDEAIETIDIPSEVGCEKCKPVHMKETGRIRKPPVVGKKVTKATQTEWSSLDALMDRQIQRLRFEIILEEKEQAVLRTKILKIDLAEKEWKFEKMKEA